LKIDKRKDRIPKQTKVLTTVETLLTNEDVKDLLDELILDQKDIDALIAIRQNKDGSMTWHITSNLPSSSIVYLLERIKSLTLEIDNKGEIHES
jgi:hypothetical protein